jgi:hypothetical protein
MSATQTSLPTSFYIVGGAMRRDAPCYVERRADAELYENLKQGQFCYVLTARQMGKSSLMVRTAARLREEGVGVAALDLTAIGQNLSAEQWYGGLLTQLGQQLDLEDELLEFRRARLVYSLAFSPDGKTLVSGGGDNRLNIWRAATEQEVRARRK